MLATHSEENKSDMQREWGVKSKVELSRPFENKLEYLFFRQWYYVDHIVSCVGVS